MSAAVYADWGEAKPIDGWATMRDALHAEWTKLRTVASTAWLLIAIVALTVLVSAASSAAQKCPSAACDIDSAKTCLIGVDFGQAVVAILAVMAMSGEYSTGMVRVTFAAIPQRLAVLAAKAAVLSGLVLAASSLAALGSLLVGRLLLPGNGFTAAHGYDLSLTDGPILRAATGSALYLGLIGLLSLGIAAAVRDAAAAVGVVLAVLYLFPIVAAMVGGGEWFRHLQQIGPMTAGLAIQNTIDLRGQPIGPWAGLGVLAAWTAAALLAGGLVLRFRDA
jgi:ABC-2 type transport system permease protein